MIIQIGELTARACPSDWSIAGQGGNHLVMELQVTVLALGRSDHLDNFLNGLVKLLIVLVPKEVARSFDPFPAVAVPEEMGRAWPDVVQLLARRRCWPHCSQRGCQGECAFELPTYTDMAWLFVSQET